MPIGVMGTFLVQGKNASIRSKSLKTTRVDRATYIVRALIFFKKSQFYEAYTF